MNINIFRRRFTPWSVDAVSYTHLDVYKRQVLQYEYSCKSLVYQPQQGTEGQDRVYRRPQTGHDGEPQVARANA